ncbi:Non-specific lipid-transfer protein [Quillaja saponaria]|uniref:Non-specific lipid-transfer protein n=1 Tax=Quillaja saponaria TaxID=32244 RepID=A0AAD7LB30_QUISA|nr:Non-specific lipid-transfer protein [Quillaja saponaria]
MEHLVYLRRLAAVLAMSTVMNMPAYGQINTPCSPSVLSTSFTPCINFLTGSSGNGTSPTADCCSSLRSLTGTGLDCLCLIVTAGVPFQVPINRNLAISLPRACKLPGVPVQCKATAAPIPAPGPASLGPSASPGFTPSPTPEASSLPEPISPALSPQSETTPLLTPQTPNVDSEAPDADATTTGSRQVLTPSYAISYNHSPHLLLLLLGLAALNYY